MKNYVKVLGVLHILFAGVPGVIGLAILFFSRAVGSVAAVSRGIGGVNSGELRAAAGHDEAMLAIAASCLLLFSLACFLAVSVIEPVLLWCGGKLMGAVFGLPARLSARKFSQVGCRDWSRVP